MFSFLKKMFGSPAAAPAAPAPARSSARAAGGEGDADSEAFVEFVARSLVDNPDAVKVSTVKGADDAVTVQIACEKRDVGKIIGKSGKTIASIRTLVNGAAGRFGRHVNVEVLD